MTIYEFGMQMEKDGENYYRELAQKTEDKGLRKILNLLAEDEIKHYELIESFRKEDPSEYLETTILKGAKNVFQELKEQGGQWNPLADQVEWYKKAQEAEQKSMDFYLSKAGEIQETRPKAIFLKLAEEEKKHYFLLENIIEFISRPKTWLENAEFHHLEEY